MDPSTIRACRAADPRVVGRRLREARRARGLTQAELGAGLASVAFISRIEAGLRRGEPELLEKLAHRLGVTLADIALTDQHDLTRECELQVDLAELALASGNAQDALARGVDLAADEFLVSHLRRRLTRVTAGAQEALGNLEAAIQLLTSITDSCPRDLAWIKDVIALSRCHREAGDPTRAIHVADEARGEIKRARLEGTTEAIQLTVTTAMSHAVLGDIATAVEMCQRAIGEADAIGSVIAKASAYWNASIFETRQGRTDAALPLAKAALAEFEHGEDSRNVGRLRSLVGELLLRLEPPRADEALATLDAARRELEWSSAGVIELARCDLFAARAHYVRGNLDLAKELAERSLEALVATTSGARAYGLVLSGEISFTEGDRDRARERFQEAAHLLTAMGDDRSTAAHWLELAAMFESIDDSANALAAYKSAAAAAGLVARAPTRAQSGHVS